MKIPIKYIVPNNGQIDGVPANPRIFESQKIQDLMASIREDPELLEYRGLLVYELGGEYIAIGGNMRLEALKRLKYTEEECEVLSPQTSVEQLKRFAIKDNANFGEWDYDALKEGWDIADLNAWNIDIPEVDFQSVDLGWGKGKEHRSDLTRKIVYHERVDYSFISMYKKSKEGKTYEEIKEDDSYVKFFGRDAVEILRKLVRLNNTEGWCVIATPKRRHKERNFACMICDYIAENMGIPFHEDVVEAKNRDRINPEFTLVTAFEEPNVIIFDDILTTGSTLKAMCNLLTDKNVVFIIGINNNS